MLQTKTKNIKAKNNMMKVLVSDLKRNKYIYVMLIPALIYYFIFHYWPMYGLTMAFKNFRPGLGIFGSPWVGLEHFKDFFSSYYFWRILKNTLMLSVTSLVFGFPAPILLALLFNELKNGIFKKIVQTISYLPHFVSILVICGMIIDFTSTKGLFNNISVMFGGERVNLLSQPQFFRPIYVISGIWQGIGWGTIIYLAALSGIDTEQYEAASIDGCSKLKQVFYITLPGIMPTIIIMLILAIGNLMNVGFEKVLLLYNPNTYETADVISTFVYRKGIQELSYSYGSAVGLFNSIINFTLLVSANYFSKKSSESSLW